MATIRSNIALGFCISNLQRGLEGYCVLSQSFQKNLKWGLKSYGPQTPLPRGSPLPISTLDKESSINHPILEEWSNYLG